MTVVNGRRNKPHSQQCKVRQGKQTKLKKVEIKMTNLELNYLNLGTYTNGTLELPASEEVINSFFERINPNGRNDCELQFVVTELDNGHLDRLSFDDLKELSEMDEDDAETLVQIFDAVSDWNEAKEIFNDGDYRTYDECNDMSDVAYTLYEETGQLAELEKHINASYIDWNAIGRDMEIEGSFHYVGNSVYLEIIR